MKEIKKSNLKFRIIMLIIIILIYIVASIFIIHMMIVRDSPKAEDGLLAATMNHIMEGPFNMKPFPVESLFIIIGLGTLIPIYLWDTKKKAQERKHYDPDTVQGDAKWLKGAFLRDYNMRFTEPFGQPTHDGKNNMILSKEMFMSLDNRGIADHNNHNSRNANVFVIGGSGSGKTFGLVGPNIMQANTSYVITDPSGELYANYGYFLENQGYHVKCLNLDHMDRGNHYNPFNYIHSDKDVTVLVTTIIANTTPPNQKAGDPFWEKTEITLLNAVIAFLYRYASKDKQNFTSVMNMIRAAEVNEQDDSYQSKLDLMFEKIAVSDPNSFALKQYRNFKQGAGKTMKSILISVLTRLNSFDLEDVARLTSTDDMDLDTIGDKKTAIFVIIPTGETTFNYIASLMYSQLFQRMYHYCENTSVFSQVVYDKNGEVVRTFRAENEDESTKIAEVKAKTFLEKAQKAKLEHDTIYDMWKLTAEDGSVLGYRRTQEEAEKTLTDLKGGWYARLGKRRLPIHVRFLLDEFANTGKIPEFPTKVSTIRKYEISTTIILQSITQLKNMYKEEWETLSGNCDNALYLGGGADESSTKWVSELIGKETRAVMNNSFSNGSSSMSINRQGAELFSASQLREMDEQECVVIQKSLSPYRGPKYNATEHPNWKWCDGTRVYTFNRDRASNIYRDYQKAGEIGFETIALNTSSHGEVEKETPKEEAVKEVKNKISKARAEEFKENVDAGGKQVIEEPKEISTENSLDKAMKAETAEDIKERASSLIEDNEMIASDEIEYIEVHAGT